ncbi:hypothetical protein COCOBI_11-4420 [Coccomyxa sp. Obi]|nr:hypothetical protein COCOBI_11-4420 [Coccomyxa sp. Obi]
MYLVQPDHMLFEPKSPAALCWLIRHWSRSRVLSVQFHELSTSCTEGTSKGNKQEDYELASRKAQDVLDSAAGLTCLQALRVNVNRLHNISPLTNLPLRHLQLELRTYSPPGRLDTLECMALLETLVVHCEGPLDVNICDVDSLAAALQVYRLQGNKKFYEIAQLRPLLTALRGLGKQYGRKRST